jgi:hypothetical protein
VPYDAYSQLPGRAYPLRAFPGQALAHGGEDTALALEYPDGEQRPKRGYPLGSHPLRHLARLQAGDGSLGIAHLSFCQLPRRSYPLGSHPGRALVQAFGAVVEVPPPSGGGGGSSYPWRDTRMFIHDRDKPKHALANDDAEVIAFLQLWTVFQSVDDEP